MQNYTNHQSLITLNNKYSTTRLCYKLIPDEYLDECGKIKEEYKFKINLPELGIMDSKIPKQGEEKFDTYLFLPPGEGRQGEGGLRTKGYFKFSYEIENGKWYACDFRGKRLFEVEPPEELDIDLEQFKSENGIIRLPLITVITVVLNGEKYFEETIQSVINQTYPNVEYIIIDGCSTDGTLDIIKKYENQIDYWVSEKDKGIYDAMNKGIKLSLGKWINFMNAGDRFYDNDVLKNVFLDKNIQIDSKMFLLVGNHAVSFDGFVKKFTIKQNNILNFYKGMPFSHQSCFINSRYHKKNKYNTYYRIAGDFDFFYVLYKNFPNKIQILDNIIALIKSGGISDINRIKTIKEWWNIVGKNDMKINLFYAKLIVLTYIKEFVKKIIGKKIVNIIRTRVV